ncbi:MULTISPECIES: glycosyltransferase family 4 protein [Flavobacterium]|uniref:glycosyltransferase family 4 protein n=1 Tax=Flavobacterium TaxID=237 RepID=UPI001FCB038C|nr:MULTISPECIES: glycosyltransferase family 4 protein [Flavobacterium]UOK43758.1 glycosyltransferase family 4 protein [Flavobacterium enshiense]
MKVLYLTKYSRLGASSRLRSFQYFPFLKEEGINVSVSPLFNDAYLEALYNGKKSLRTVFFAYLKRFVVLFSVFKYDKVVIEKELFPYFPAFFELFLSLFGVCYIVDYDDAIFHNYDLSNNKMIRFFLSNKIGIVMKNAENVVAGNEYLAEKARVSGAKNVVIIPTVIDISRYDTVQLRDREKIVVGWIGSPSTFKYVKNIFPVFEELAKHYPIEVHIVGANEDVPVSFPVQFIKWAEYTEVDSIAAFDIGIMPLENSCWEKGKCAYKLIQYMACGLPVVASPVGMNREVVLNGINGYLADTEALWYAFLEELLKNPAKCSIFGSEGIRLVERHYTVQVQLQQVLDVLTMKK